MQPSPSCCHAPILHNHMTFCKLVTCAGDWDPDKFVHCTQGTVPPLDAEQLPVALSGRATVQGSTSANASPQCSNLYMLPVEATSSCSDSPEVRWGGHAHLCCGQAEGSQLATCCACCLIGAFPSQGVARHAVAQQQSRQLGAEAVCQHVQSVWQCCPACRGCSSLAGGTLS